MTLLNRLVAGSIIEGVQVVAIYDPFFGTIDIEVDDRPWSSLDRSQCVQFRANAETFATDLHYLLVDSYNFEEVDAASKLQACLANIDKYCR